MKSTLSALRCSLQEDQVERLSAHREAVADGAWILWRPLSTVRFPAGVVELPRKRRTAEVEDGVQNAQPLEYVDHAGVSLLSGGWPASPFIER